MKQFLKRLPLAYLAGLLMITSVTAVYGNTLEKPLVGQEIFNLTEAIQYSDQGFANKPVFKGEN